MKRAAASSMARRRSIFREHDSMGHWGFVLLAYGIVWCSILLYTVALKRRIRNATLRRTEAATEADGHEA